MIYDRAADPSRDPHAPVQPRDRGSETDARQRAPDLPVRTGPVPARWVGRGHHRRRRGASDGRPRSGLARAGAAVIRSPTSTATLSTRRVALVRAEGDCLRRSPGTRATPLRWRRRSPPRRDPRAASTCSSTTRASTRSRADRRSSRSTVWEHVLHTNLTGYFLHAQEAAARMIAARPGAAAS